MGVSLPRWAPTLCYIKSSKFWTEKGGGPLHYARDTNAHSANNERGVPLLGRQSWTDEGGQSVKWVPLLPTTWQTSTVIEPGKSTGGRRTTLWATTVRSHSTKDASTFDPACRSVWGKSELKVSYIAGAYVAGTDTHQCRVRGLSSQAD